MSEKPFNIKKSKRKQKAEVNCEKSKGKKKRKLISSEKCPPPNAVNESKQPTKSSINRENNEPKQNSSDLKKNKGKKKVNSKLMNTRKKIKKLKKLPEDDEMQGPKKIRKGEIRNEKKKKEEEDSTTEVENTTVEYDNEKSLEEIPDFDHVPSDSEEESELKPQQTDIVTKTPEKKLYTDFTENTVFVGNLPLNYDKKKLTKVFNMFGPVVCARIRCVPIANINMKKKVAAIKKEFNAKRNSVVGYVKFKSEESVKAAVAANGMLLDGHHLRIDSANSTEERDSKKAIFVGGLPFDVEDDELWEFFENCGKINSVRVIRDSHTSMGKGIGYVNFDSTTAVELALQMDGQELKKRVINVKRCLSINKKNKMRTFGRKKTKEMVSELLSKKNRTSLKLKMKEVESKHKLRTEDFLGTKAAMKKKKRKKPSKDVLRKKHIVKILKK